MLNRSAKITIEILEGQEILEKGQETGRRLWNYIRWCLIGYNEKLRHERGDDWERFKRNQAYNRTGEKYPGRFGISQNLRDYWAAIQLNDTCYQKICDEFDISMRSWFSNLKKNPKARPPRYSKESKQLTFSVGGNAKPLGDWTYRLSVLGRVAKDRYVKIKIHVRPNIKMNQVRLIRIQPDGTGTIVYRVEEKHSKGKQICGIDLGVINLATIVFSNGGSIIYSGRGLISALQWQQKQAAQCKPKNWERGKAESRQSENLKSIKRKGGNIQKLAVHNLTTDIIRQCLKKEVGKIVIGDLTGIRNDTDFGKVKNQVLHNWSFAEIRRQIEYKAEEVGIEVIAVNERGTSSHCCFCGNKVIRKPRGFVHCSNCGTMNSDINGAINIMNKVSPNGVEAILPGLPSPLPENENRRSSQVDPVFVANFNLRNWSIEQTYCNTIDSSLQFSCV